MSALLKMWDGFTDITSEVGSWFGYKPNPPTYESMRMRCGYCGNDVRRGQKCECRNDQVAPTKRGSGPTKADFDAGKADAFVEIGEEAESADKTARAEVIAKSFAEAFVARFVETIGTKTEKKEEVKEEVSADACL